MGVLVRFITCYYQNKIPYIPPIILVICPSRNSLTSVSPAPKSLPPLPVVVLLIHSICMRAPWLTRTIYSTAVILCLVVVSPLLSTVVRRVTCLRLYTHVLGAVDEAPLLPVVPLAVHSFLCGAPGLVRTPYRATECLVLSFIDPVLKTVRGRHTPGEII